jgi:hypothetical protein
MLPCILNLLYRWTSSKMQKSDKEPIFYFMSVILFVLSFIFIEGQLKWNFFEDLLFTVNKMLSQYSILFENKFYTKIFVIFMTLIIF